MQGHVQRLSADAKGSLSLCVSLPSPAFPCVFHCPFTALSNAAVTNLTSAANRETEIIFGVRTLPFAMCFHLLFVTKTSPLPCGQALRRSGGHAVGCADGAAGQTAVRHCLCLPLAFHCLPVTFHFFFTAHRCVGLPCPGWR